MVAERPQVVCDQRPRGRFRAGHGHHRSRRAASRPGQPVPGAHGHARRGAHTPNSHHGRGGIQLVQPLGTALQGCGTARRRATGTPRFRLPRGPGTLGTRTHPPLHAMARHLPPGTRHDGSPWGIPGSGSGTSTGHAAVISACLGRTRSGKSRAPACWSWTPRVKSNKRAMSSCAAGSP